MKLILKQLNIEASMKGGERSRIVSDLSFSVERGKRLAIVGQSGCGKTMTAMAILGLLPENCNASGEVLWDGQNMLAMDTKKRRTLLGRDHVLIPQSGADFLNPSRTVRSQMTEALVRNGVERSGHGAKLKAMLEQVGFDDPERVLRSYPFQLSGGMAQRVVMIMAAVGHPCLVIADEPTKGVDQENTLQFVNNLDKLFHDAAVILITHDISVASVCDDILVMKNGVLEEYEETKQVLTDPQSVHTHQLICDLPHSLSHVERGII